MNERVVIADRARKIVYLPLPTHKLVSRVAGLRGMTMSDTVYAVFRDELRRQGEGKGWEIAPDPFVVKPTYDEAGCVVLLWHPVLPSLKLSRAEARGLAEGLRRAVDGLSLEGEIETESGPHCITITRGGHHVGLHVDGDHVAMVRPVASDVADALIAASVHAGPIPTGGPN